MNKRIVELESILLLLSGLPVMTMGCGGEATTSGGGTANADCSPICTKMAASKCPKEDPNTCVSDCQATVAHMASTQCNSAYSTWSSCVASKATFTCDSSGDAVANGCDSETSSLQSCAVCSPAASDTSCASCEKSKCCAELSVAATTAEAQGYLTCVQPCTGATCIDACKTKYPTASAANDKVSQCVVANCKNECTKNG